MKPEVVMEIKSKKYFLWLKNIKDKERIDFFTGGHRTVGETLYELGRKYKRIDKIKEKILLEEGEITDIDFMDFHIWFFLDIFEKDKKHMFFFNMQKEAGEIQLKPRDEGISIPESKNFVINNIQSISEVEVEVVFTSDNEYSFVIHSEKGIGIQQDLKDYIQKSKDKDIMKTIKKIADEIYLDDWLPKTIFRQ